MFSFFSFVFVQAKLKRLLEGHTLDVDSKKAESLAAEEELHAVCGMLAAERVEIEFLELAIEA